MATPLARSKIQVAYLNSIQQPRIYMPKISRFLARNWNLCNFGLFCLILVTIATPLVLLKIEIAYSRRRKNMSFYAKKSSISCTELKSVQFWLFFVQIWLPWQLPWFLKILIAHWNSPAPKCPLYMQKISRFLAGNWWVHIFAQIWLPWQPPWLPWNFIYHIWIRRARKLLNYVINSSISCTELK